jgi:preprotein translocase subunit SecB
VSEEQQRQFVVQRIYTKDLSFEAPNSPRIFQDQWKPEIKVGLGSDINKLADDAYELVLKVSVEAKHEDKTVFLVEVQQAGLFSIQGFEQQEIDALLGVAAPNILFPYAREIVSDLVTRGSFPQFVLQPVNFEGLYSQQLQARANQAENADEGEPTVQ